MTCMFFDMFQKHGLTRALLPLLPSLLKVLSQMIRSSNPSLNIANSLIQHFGNSKAMHFNSAIVHARCFYSNLSFFQPFIVFRPFYVVPKPFKVTVPRKLYPRFVKSLLVTYPLILKTSDETVHNLYHVCRPCKEAEHHAAALHTFFHCIGGKSTI